jgi:hypothetical protein
MALCEAVISSPSREGPDRQLRNSYIEGGKIWRLASAHTARRANGEAPPGEHSKRANRSAGRRLGPYTLAFLTLFQPTKPINRPRSKIDGKKRGGVCAGSSGVRKRHGAASIGYQQVGPNGCDVGRSRCRPGPPVPGTEPHVPRTA